MLHEGVTELASVSRLLGGGVWFLCVCMLIVSSTFCLSLFASCVCLCVCVAIGSGGKEVVSDDIGQNTAR